MEELRQQLIALGVRLVKVRYSGCGDSGAVDEKTFLNSRNQELTLPEDLDTNNIDNLTDHIDGDWYNNDGGQGMITWDLKLNKLRINAEFNILEIQSDTQEVQL